MEQPRALTGCLRSVRELARGGEALESEGGFTLRLQGGELRPARMEPLLGSSYQAVLHRVAVDVIDPAPEIALGPEAAIPIAVPDLAAGGDILSIELSGALEVQSFEQLGDRPRFLHSDDGVVVVGK